MEGRNHKGFNVNDSVNWVCLSHIYFFIQMWRCTFLMMQLRSPLDRLNGFLDNIIKVNVDRSSLSNLGRSGFGGLIRNNNGDWLLDFFLDFVVLLLAWRPNCMPFFMAFVLRMMWATRTIFLNQILGWLLI